MDVGKDSASNKTVYDEEKVIGHREFDPEKLEKSLKTDVGFRVQWVGYPPEDATWEPRQNSSFTKRLHEYHDRVSSMLSKRFPPEPPSTHTMRLRSSQRVREFQLN